MSEDANYYDRFADHKQQNNPKPEKQKKEKYFETTYSLAKIFGYMFAGLFITAAIALGLGILLDYLLISEGVVSDTALIIFLVILITSSIALIVMSFVVPIVAVRGKHSVLVPAIIYSVLMGVMLSAITAFIPWYLLGITFGVTSLMFGLMALIALLSKSRLNGLAIVAIGLVTGAMVMSLILFILMITNVMTGDLVWLYWVISLVMLVAIMLITIWDIARIKQIAQQGEMTRNLSLYCAYILYNDFIHVFIRVLRIVLIIASKAKR